MRRIEIDGAGAMVVLTMALLAGCGGKLPDDLGLQDGKLQPCPSSPNCVSSDATDEVHGIDALAIKGDAAPAWAALEAELAGLPRVEVVHKEGGYIHAVFTTKLMRYRDDVEFALDEASDSIAVRSASRVGYGDMDANRDRVESLRAALAARGAVHAKR